VVDHARSPWFVTQSTSILDILEQFRRNNQGAAIALDPSGQASGILSLDEIMAQIFGPETEQPSLTEAPDLYVARTLPGDMAVAQFNREFQAELSHGEGETLSDLILQSLDHLPAKGETARVGSFLFTVVEPSMRGVRILSVHTLQE